MKKLKGSLFVIMLLLLVVACDADYSSTDNSTTNNIPTVAEPQPSPHSTKTPKAPPALDLDFTITPGKSVGLITLQSTEADIINAYGEANVDQREIGMGEGETAPGTLLFPYTENELVIVWEDGKTYEKIASIRVDGENSNWKTVDGIEIGTSLETLEEINGKPFQFYGFEWDYAGTTNDWQGGNINEHISVILTPTKPEAAFPDLIGDQLFSSDHPKAKAAGLKVSSIMLKF